MMVESQNNGHVGTSNFCPLWRGVHSLEVRDVLALYSTFGTKFTPKQSLSEVISIVSIYLKYPLSEVS